MIIISWQFIRQFWQAMASDIRRLDGQDNFVYVLDSDEDNSRDIPIKKPEHVHDYYF
jgi:hypothetical protein